MRRTGSAVLIRAASATAWWLVATHALAGCDRSPATPERPAYSIASDAIELWATSGELHNVVELRATPDGEVWLVDSAEPFVRRYSRDGTLMAEFGRRGKGPGELMAPASVLVDAADTVRIWDPGRRRVVLFDKEGRFAGREIPIPLESRFVRADISSVSYARAHLMERVGELLVFDHYPDGITRTRDFAWGLLVAVDASGAVSDTLVDFRSLTNPEAALGTEQEELVPVPLWAVCGTSEIAVWDPYVQRVHWMDHTGATFRTDTVPLPSRVLTERDIERYLRAQIANELRERRLAPDGPEIDRVVQRMIAQQRRMFGSKAPAAVRMLCDGYGRLWFQGFDTTVRPTGHGHEWRVYGSGGLLGTVVFPETFQPLAIHSDAVFGVVTDRLDVQSIGVTAIPEPLRAPRP